MQIVIRHHMESVWSVCVCVCCMHVCRCVYVVWMCVPVLRARRRCLERTNAKHFYTTHLRGLARISTEIHLERVNKSFNMSPANEISPR